MKHFVIDIGNSRVKWAMCHSEDNKLYWHGSFDYDSDESASFNMQVDAHWLKLPAPDAILLASVGNPEMTRQVEIWLCKNWRQPQHLRATSNLCGVRNAYSNPERLGVDRWAAIIAAYHMEMGPVFVVDCGTAITLDLVDGKGQHLGGFILPGLTVMRRSLRENTRDLPFELGNAFVEARFANNTADAITIGTTLAAAAAIEKTALLAEKYIGGAPAGIITGGDALLLKPLLNCSLRYEPYLVLKGLAHILNHSQKREA